MRKLIRSFKENLLELKFIAAISLIFSIVCFVLYMLIGDSRIAISVVGWTYICIIIYSKEEKSDKSRAISIPIIFLALGFIFSKVFDVMPSCSLFLCVGFIVISINRRIFKYGTLFVYKKIFTDSYCNMWDGIFSYRWGYI